MIPLLAYLSHREWAIVECSHEIKQNSSYLREIFSAEGNNFQCLPFNCCKLYCISREMLLRFGVACLFCLCLSLISHPLHPKSAFTQELVISHSSTINLGNCWLALLDKLTAIVPHACPKLRHSFLNTYKMEAICVEEDWRG